MEASHCPFQLLNVKQEKREYQFLVFGLIWPGIEPNQPAD